jgi:hypothetical protein
MRKTGIFLATALLTLAPAGAWQRGAKPAGLADPRPVTREQATASLMPAASTASRCLTPAVQLARGAQPAGHLPQTLELLGSGSPFGQERRLHRHDGLVVRYPSGRPVRGGETLPVEVQAGLDGFDQAAGLFAGRMEMIPPTGLEIVFLTLGEGLDGYVLPAAAPPERSLIVLNVTPAGGVDAIRRAAIHQYAHMVTLRLSGRFPAVWGEALATWSVMALEGSPDAGVLEAIDARLAEPTRGWFDQPVGDLAGNAVWFDFVDRMYGLITVRTALEELAVRGDAAPAWRRRCASSTSGRSSPASARRGITSRTPRAWERRRPHRATMGYLPFPFTAMPPCRAGGPRRSGCVRRLRRAGWTCASKAISAPAGRPTCCCSTARAGFVVSR